MIPAKWNYVMAGFALAFALLCALAGDVRAFIFLALAMYDVWLGDHKLKEAEKDKGDNNG